MLGPLREGAPRRIGPYEVLARLGAGGMGEVYLARRDASGAFFAVKTVRRDLAGDPAFRDRFRREIKVAGLVRSAYATAPVGGDADAEVPWLATAYVPGPSLSQAVRRGGPLPVATVRALGARIARALADLHGAGVLHRDLKPGNVMLAADGPRLIDFGIARASGATTMTATGLMVGTPAFMSPEHVAGARHVTGASDVFCLGSLLCYAATGEDPFGDGPVAAVLYRVSQAEADLERVPEELRPVVTACLAPAPADRPAPEALVELLGGDTGRPPAWPEGVRDHIGAYGTELAQLVASGGPLVELPPRPAAAPGSTPSARAPVGAPGLHAAETLAPVAPPTPASAPPPRKRRRALLAAATALAVLGGGLGAYLLWPEGQPERPVTAGPPAPSAPRIPGVDDRGLADASGVVPQHAAQRPAGWKPWRAKLTAPAFGCSANEKALVCRTTDGWYEALDPASGKKLWEANLGEGKRGGFSYISDHGQVWIADDSARPTVHDSAVVLAAGGKLQVRDARTGTVRWEKTATGSQGTGSRPVVGDGTVFVAAKATESYERNRIGMTAYALADGRKLWSKELTNNEVDFADDRPYEPVAYAAGRLYALSDRGLLAYDGKSGALLGEVDPEAQDCEEVKVLGSSAYCVSTPHVAGAQQRLHLLDAATLATKGSVPAPVGTLHPDVITPEAVVGFDNGLKVYGTKDGTRLGSYPLKDTTPPGLDQALSTPLLAGDRVVYADYSALYTLRLGPDGRPGALKVTPVPGAPGPRAEEDERDPDYGILFARMIRQPEVLPVGGIAYLVYDKGAVVAVELPE
ncbi:protein kinase [Streptomyces sp. NPDC012769]|uniref:protein kinase domain-containing protein n=1 Tax=Streptomyces sp. NPDC012769 TaxID=3364848 RepID=UPI0036C3569D